MPIIPPLAANLTIRSSLRPPAPDTAAAVTWLATTGAWLTSMIWFCASVEAWVMSMRIPSAFISSINARPRSLMPPQWAPPRGKPPATSEYALNPLCEENCTDRRPSR